MASRLYEWLDSRLRLKPIGKTLLDEPIPGGASWQYVFGSATLFLFVLQAVTGMFLAMYYVPSTDHAYSAGTSLLNANINFSFIQFAIPDFFSKPFTCLFIQLRIRFRRFCIF